MEPYEQTNRELWDTLAGWHVKSEFYDVEGFKGGKCSLEEIEVSEVGDVAGKSLLHLQCHFGMDSLSWARRGAVVTGVDFSPAAINTARGLAREIGVPATFVCSSVYELDGCLDDTFDIVFTSAGVLCWLSDLDAWARAVAQHLKPGGFFFIREFHPFADVFDDDAPEPRLRYPYFRTEKPLVYTGQGSYASAGNGEEVTSVEWPHSLSEIVNALIGAGLGIEYIHEFDYCSYPHRAFLKERKGRWTSDHVPKGLPLQFTIRARRGTA